MPTQTIHCKKCGAPISGYTFSERMSKLRRHYKEKHIGIFKRAIKRGAKKRRKRR
jgi:hypothetical protein